MRIAFLFTALFLLGSFNANAGTHYPLSANAFYLACNVPDGLAASNITDTSATLTWNAVPGATKYNLEIEDEQNNPSNFHIETTVSGTTYNVAGLQAGVLYKFKVRTRCGDDKSDWSEWVFFVAGSGSGGGGGNGTCAVPGGLGVSVNDSSATLTWNVVSGAVKYTIEIEDEQNPPSTFHLEDSSATNTYIFNGLQTGVLYKFKVRAHCASGQSDWSGWLFFNGSTGGQGGGNGGTCSVPSGLTVTNITQNSATLGWNAVSGATSYTLEIERNHPNTTAWQITQVVTTNSFVLTGLGADTRYKFKVRSNCDSSSHSDWSSWRKFKTANAFVVKTGNNVSPDDGMTDRNDFSSSNAILAFEMQVWPNPAQTTTTIHLQNVSAESVTLRLFDLTGSMVQEQIIYPENNVWEGAFVLGNLPDGMYLMQASDGQQTQTVKLIVSR